MTAPSTARMAVLGRCPRCGSGPLFSGFLSVAKACTHCDLAYAAFDAGDGPAVFVILIVGFLVAGGALIVEVTFQPAYWVHAVLWLPAVLILSFGFLRLLKSTLLVLHYKHQAGEGRLAD